MDVFQQSRSQKIQGSSIFIIFPIKSMIEIDKNQSLSYYNYVTYIIFYCPTIKSYDHGGVLLSTKKDQEQLTPPLLNSKRQPHGKEPNW